ncbi:PaaX family transcriptional regulator [Knoellia remsis]|uniref:PaaX family transcriptional regulator n=1 Tax=Knoellia remsis TaxID=407159 RepID=A0A2T0UCH4_9MICO|nr:PaaX family transcriptional regulator C-terminal domain-containing protein [Knoellia remsis]PRY55619.1 PaaX family transcriptional regulator [Knoellia remsis]
MSSPLVPPVTARSAVLSLLLGAHPPSLSGRDIVTAMGLFGISEATTRVALTRMVASGDLTRDDAVYTLSARLIQRQRDAQPPQQRPWDGTWEMEVVTTTGRSPADRSALRTDMRRRRLAELREGVWTRPANLEQDPDGPLDEVVTRFRAQPQEDPSALAARLWDLEAWAARCRAYLDALRAAQDDGTRFFTMVAAVGHLGTDPALPPELLPADWPVDELTTVYADYRAELDQLRSGG